MQIKPDTERFTTLMILTLFPYILSLKMLYSRTHVRIREGIFHEFRTRIYVRNCTNLYEFFCTKNWLCYEWPVLYNYQKIMSLNVCLDVVQLVCSELYTNFFLYSKFVDEFLKFRVRIFSFVLISCANSCTNSWAN